MPMNATVLKTAIVAAIEAVPPAQRATLAGSDQIWQGISEAIVACVQSGVVTVSVAGVTSGPSTAVGVGSVL